MSKNKHMLLGIGLTVVLTAVGYITFLEPMISYFKINQSAVNIDIQTSKTKSTLPIPPLLEDKNPDPNIADFTLEPQEGETSFLPNTKTQLWVITEAS